MGDKTAARRRMQAAGVPIVPGMTRPLGSVVEARPEAARLGYPVLLKAAAGGGGKGMRLVREERELGSAFEAARSEALKAFGAGEVYLEKYLERARHVEGQILADANGRVVALGACAGSCGSRTGYPCASTAARCSPAAMRSSAASPRKTRSTTSSPRPGSCATCARRRGRECAGTAGWKRATRSPSSTIRSSPS